MDGKAVAKRAFNSRLMPGQSAHASSSSSSHSDYVRGSIVRVKVVNFVTYDACELRPGPHLNVVMGPNGTGKSTIVCAICLGLGGHQKLLGRQKDIGEFVKHGAESASIEIELYSGDPALKNTVIRRDITKRDNTSHWHIDGRATTMAEAQRLVESLKIDMNNKCQFLPQDKVVEFAKMTPEELLVATEQAVGSPELHSRHLQLNALYAEEKHLTKAYHDVVAQRDRLEKEKASLERQVHLFEERERHLQQVDMLKKKRPWIEYEDVRVQFIAAKERKVQAQAEYDRKEAEINPMVARGNEFRAKIKQSDVAKTKILSEIGALEKKISTMNAAIAAANDDMEKISNELQYNRALETRIKGSLETVEKEISDLTKQLNEVVNDESVIPRIEALSQELQGYKMDLLEIGSQSAQARTRADGRENHLRDVQHQLARLLDVGARRERDLERLDPGAFSAVMWLRKNRDKFQGEVCEPLGLVAQSKSPEHASMIETCIPKQDIWAIIFERRDDQSTFIRLMKSLGYRANSICPPEDSLESYRPDIPLDEIRRFGFKGYLVDMVEAPILAKKHLCFKNHFHTIAYGDESVERDIANISRKSGLREFVTHKNRYSQKNSLFGDGAVSSRVTALRPAEILGSSGSSAINEQRSELERQVAEIKAELEDARKLLANFAGKDKAIREKMSQLNAEKDRLNERRRKRQQVEASIRAKQAKKSDLQDGLRDARATVEAKHEELRKVCVKRAKTVVGLQQVAVDCTRLLEARINVTLELAQSRMELSLIEEQERQLKELLKSAKDQLQVVVEETERLKTRAKDLYQKAKETELTSDIQAAFALLPSTLEEIDQMIHMEQAAADLNNSTDHRVVERYKEISTRLGDLDAEASVREKAKRECDEKVSALKESWLGELNEKLAKINVAFGRGFERLRCSGEVMLKADEDYSKYGIEISVQFRQNEGMHRLTAHHQSGGERSVSTVLYMMALQELTTCPFRVVDEINQGMDPNNERLIFSHIVQVASLEHTPQCFYITPKLLPGLEFSEKVNVLCVYNGIWNMSHKLWALDRLISSARNAMQA